MNALVAVASNHAAYDSAKNDARLLGNNFRTTTNRKRTMAVSFITAVVTEGWQLEGLIDECKTEMKYRKLDPKDQSQAATFFSDLRYIVGKWDKLPNELRQQFLDGHIVYSTLKTRIKDAVKKAEEAEDLAESTAKAGEDARSHVNEDLNRGPAQAQAQAQAPSDPLVAAMQSVSLWLDEGAKPEGMSVEQMLALKNMIDAVDEFRAAVAKKVAIAA